VSGISSKAIHEASTPTTGTSMENGATTFDGCRASSEFQIP